MLHHAHQLAAISDGEHPCSLAAGASAHAQCTVPNPGARLETAPTDLLKRDRTRTPADRWHARMHLLWFDGAMHRGCGKRCGSAAHRPHRVQLAQGAPRRTRRGASEGPKPATLPCGTRPARSTGTIGRGRGDVCLARCPRPQRERAALHSIVIAAGENARRNRRPTDALSEELASRSRVPFRLLVSLVHTSLTGICESIGWSRVSHEGRPWCDVTRCGACFQRLVCAFIKDTTDSCDGVV